METRFVSAADFLAVLPEIASEGGIVALARRISAGGGGSEEAVQRRLFALVHGEQQSVGLLLADRMLTALDMPDAVRQLTPDFAPPSTLICEDCGQEIEPDVMPIDLFRNEPASLEGRVWDRTKQSWVRRPGRANAGGRRFRLWHLCRVCRAEAIRDRSVRFSSNGRGKTLKRTDRIAPRRGGRPRLLSDEELRAAYKIYLDTGLSRREIAHRLHAGRDKGTAIGYEQALLYGWRRLGLKLRPLAAQIAISRHGADVAWTPKESRRCKRILRSGKRCTQWVRRDGQQPAEDGLCWNHAMQGRRKHDRSAGGLSEPPGTAADTS